MCDIGVDHLSPGEEDAPRKIAVFIQIHNGPRRRKPSIESDISDKAEDKSINSSSTDSSNELTLREGENWLRLISRNNNGTKSVLDETQDDPLSQDHQVIPFPAILTGLNAAEHNQALDETCFLIIDLDDSHDDDLPTVAVKDMRRPEDRSMNAPFEICLARRTRTGKEEEKFQDGNTPTGGIWDGYSSLEALPKRQLRILSPGDRLCTRSPLSGYTSDEEDDFGTVGLILELRMEVPSNSKCKTDTVGEVEDASENLMTAVEDDYSKKEAGTSLVVFGSESTDAEEDPLTQTQKLILAQQSQSESDGAGETNHEPLGTQPSVEEQEGSRLTKNDQPREAADGDCKLLSQDTDSAFVTNKAKKTALESVEDDDDATVGEEGETKENSPLPSDSAIVTNKGKKTDLESDVDDDDATVGEEGETKHKSLPPTDSAIVSNKEKITALESDVDDDDDATVGEDGGIEEKSQPPTDSALVTNKGKESALERDSNNHIAEEGVTRKKSSPPMIIGSQEELGDNDNLASLAKTPKATTSKKSSGHKEGDHVGTIAGEKCQKDLAVAAEEEKDDTVVAADAEKATDDHVPLGTKVTTRGAKDQDDDVALSDKTVDTSDKDTAVGGDEVKASSAKDMSKTKVAGEATATTECSTDATYSDSKPKGRARARVDRSAKKKAPPKNKKSSKKQNSETKKGITDILSDNEEDDQCPKVPLVQERGKEEGKESKDALVTNGRSTRGRSKRLHREIDSEKPDDGHLKDPFPCEHLASPSPRRYKTYSGRRKRGESPDILPKDDIGHTAKNHPAGEGKATTHLAGTQESTGVNRADREENKEIEVNSNLLPGSSSMEKDGKPSEANVIASETLETARKTSDEGEPPSSEPSRKLVVEVTSGKPSNNSVPGEKKASESKGKETKAGLSEVTEEETMNARDKDTFYVEASGVPIAEQDAAQTTPKVESKRRPKSDKLMRNKSKVTRGSLIPSGSLSPAPQESFDNYVPMGPAVSSRSNDSDPTSEGRKKRSIGRGQNKDSPPPPQEHPEDKRQELSPPAKRRRRGQKDAVIKEEDKLLKGNRARKKETLSKAPAEESTVKEDATIAEIKETPTAPPKQRTPPTRRAQKKKHETPSEPPSDETHSRKRCRQHADEGESASVAQPAETPAKSTRKRQLAERKDEKLAPILVASLEKTPVKSSRKTGKKNEAEVVMPPEETHTNSTRKGKPPMSNEEGGLGSARAPTMESVEGEKRKKICESGELLIATTNVTLTASEKSIIKKLGGKVIDDVMKTHLASHVIAGSEKLSMRRTPKVMIGLCSTPNVVGLEWLIASGRANKVLPADDYLLTADKEAEERYSFSMQASLKRAAEMREKGMRVLSGWSVHVCKGVAGCKAPPEKELKAIVEQAGGIWISTLSQKKPTDFSRLLIVTGDPETKKQVSAKPMQFALECGARKQTATWLFHCLINQEVSFD